MRRRALCRSACHDLYGYSNHPLLDLLMPDPLTFELGILPYFVEGFTGMSLSLVQGEPATESSPCFVLGEDRVAGC